MNFHEFFKAATGYEPYDYQFRIAGGDAGCKCESRLINIPTGLDKTAAMVLAWLWNRIQILNPEWPRRLSRNSWLQALLVDSLTPQSSRASFSCHFLLSFSTH